MPVTERWKKLSTEIALKGQGATINAYVGLATASFVPESNPIIGEMYGTGYQRQPVSWTDFTADMRNLAPILWVVSGSWPAGKYVFLSDSSQGGQVLMYGNVPTINSSSRDTITIPTGSLILT